ncbi:MAG: 50S ribosomal protein L25 [bacterium]|nr:50S ribosomal protein L25 [bacterium]
MSSDIITLKLTVRSEHGKAVKALRRTGFVPANIYERGKESQSVSAPFIELTKVYRQAGKHHPVELVLDGKTHLAMIKEVDLDPIKNTLRHVGFHAVNKNETVEAEVPIKIQGEVPAERLSLMVLQNLDTVMVEAIPANLPNELFVDGTKLAEVGDKILVSDIKVPKDVVITSDPETMVFSVDMPKDQIAAADAALEENAPVSDVEPEEGAVDTEATDSQEKTE